jgi:hypothetical protein
MGHGNGTGGELKVSPYFWYKQWGTGQWKIRFHASKAMACTLPIKKLPEVWYENIH